MGKSIINTVVDILMENGIQAAPAQPPENMLIIHAPVAAVSIEKMDTAERTVDVLVEVVAPIKSGGEQCQKRALEVCRILRTAGADCVQGSCTFHGRPTLFCVPVKARFYGTALADEWIPRATCDVTLAGIALAHITSFTAQQVVDEDHTTLAQAPWTFTLEEFIPVGTPEQAAPEEPFEVQMGSQFFTGCTMTECRRIYTVHGIEQTRKGIAETRTIR